MTDKTGTPDPWTWARGIAALRQPQLSRRGFLNLAAAGGAATLIAPRLLRAQPAEPTGQVIAGISQEPTVFNPLMLHIEVDEGVYFNIYNPLWGVDPDGNFTPQLAAEIPSVENGGLSEDGLNWTIRLRDGVVWHDGTPFTADDVKFSLELTVDENFRSARRAGHDLLTDITVVSPTEITWRMTQPYAPYMALLASTFIVPKHIVEAAADPNDSELNTHPIGTGPFKWVNRVAGDHIELAANPDYFGEGPYLETLVFKYIPDMTVLYTQFQTGDIDYIGLQGITPDHFAEAEQLPDRVVMPIPQPFIENIGFNMGKPQFQDLAVRQALYLAMDKAAIIDAIYYGLPKPAESYIPEGNWAYNPDLPQHEYNPERAKQILDEAGWVPGPDGIREKDGVRLAFTNSTTAGNHVREQAQQLLQQTWREIGAEMEINNLPPAVMWGDYWMMSEFDSAMVGIAFMVGPDPDTTDYFHSQSIAAQAGAGQNTVQYANPEVDALLEAGTVSVDREERKQIYYQQQEIIRHDLPYLPIFQYAMVEGTKAGFVGYTPNINVRINSWNASEWYWES
ncbi:MAG: peptide ABC transporter substrate-binding protein [Rhodospirillaceae bacterium]|nr:peptide ABC transporter substrate-binding protein [Rhodospirillaceae bacterium]